MLKIKNKYLFLIVLLLFIGVYALQYALIVNYITSFFKYNNEVKMTTLNEEKALFYMSITEKFAFAISKFIGSIICINIGLLFFNYKIKIQLVIKIVLYSITIFSVVQLFILLFMIFQNYIFSTAIIETIESTLYKTKYLNLNSKASFLKLPLQIFNITHILYFIVLAFGISKLIKKSYIKSIYFTFKTYGIGVLIWFVFAIIMELNFN